MFLFTSTPSPGPASQGIAPQGNASRTTSGNPVIEAIRQGAEKTGAAFDYLLSTAQRESSLNPSAKAGTSSATGLFQFIEQTWLGVMKQDGPSLGLGSYADAITARSSGGYAVSDPAARQAILDLRRDPEIASAMAGALTRRNADALSDALGREPNRADLYAAHLLGVRGALTLIRAAETAPGRSAAADLPEAAAGNRGLFYDRTGRARSASELYAVLGTSPAAPAPAATAATQGAQPTAYAPEAGSGLRSLFQTDARRGPVSDSVARLWGGRGSGAAAPSYFPRSNEGPVLASAAPAPPAGTDSGSVAPATLPDAFPGGVPLPPARPREYGGGRNRAALSPSPIQS
ncbi:transglycosylase SLT domain-containing protein [Methylobacterium nonmethylotrophicum]|uniref:Lytic transglycosylase domain-containing protein n=1 Tax=Methylobacterium nonmethylotrophicum TaxID=1141884 RepID=A0A4Z0NQN5_9HYPH|nr:transglycosylase SLT domain-containing protein [Methylobacterium nonmethylotrophicum]TGD98635.1 lytic transglycosylase domain-containing protein [Methylobacterium nonmethylotrophicum]